MPWVFYLNSPAVAPIPPEPIATGEESENTKRSPLRTPKAKLNEKTDCWNHYDSKLPASGELTWGRC